MYLESSSQVWGIVGNLGGGKTLTAVEIACHAMQSGYFVCTNISLDMPAVCADFGVHCASLYQLIDMEVDDPALWPCGDPRGSGGSRRVLVIIDEVAEWFDQFSSTSGRVKAFMSWIRHCSKRGQDVFLIVQRREYLAKSLRILVSRWIWVDDLAVFRIPKLRMRIPFCAHLCYRSYFDRVGNVVQPGSSVSKVRFGRYYSTAQCLSVSLDSGRVYESPDIAVPVRSYGWLWVLLALLIWIFI